MNGANVVVNHTMFTGMVDIWSMFIKTFEQDVLSGLHKVLISIYMILTLAGQRPILTIKESILIIAWPTIKNTIFNITCPETVNKTSLSLETITQNYYDDNLGNVTTLSVQVYLQHRCHTICAMC